MADNETDIVLPLFHVGTKQENQQFISDKNELLESTEDGDWCGAGMYFWDNLSNANFWLSSKKKRSESYNIVKVSMKINEDRLLDLTSLESVKDFEKSLRNL